MLERVHRALLFNFDGEPIGGTEDMTDYAGVENNVSTVIRYSPKNCLRK